MDELASAPAGELDDWDAVETVVACERVIGRASAIQADALARLAQIRGDRDRTWRDTTDEVAAALRVSTFAAGNRVAFAVGLAERLPRTRAALHAGDVTAAKARAVWEATIPLDDATARRVEDHVLGRAPEQTPARLRECLRRAVLRADPAGAGRRHRVRRLERRVEKSALDDGMGSLWAYLTGVESCAVFTRLTDIAHAAKVPGDGRSVDERRADALVALCLGRDPLPRAPSGGPAGSPGCGSPGGSPRTGTAGSGIAARVQVTVPVGTLIGLDDGPGGLAGYGPIPASVARALAAEGTWRRLLTDPATGALLDYGRTRYRPPANLADFVRARDVTCRFPTCRQPAWRADLDHVRPWPAGPTAEHNLGPLCRRHHQLKQRPDWHVTRHPDGTWTWTAPTGHTHTTPPETTTTHPIDLTRSGPAQVNAAPDRDADREASHRSPLER